MSRIQIPVFEDLLVWLGQRGSPQHSNCLQAWRAHIWEPAVWGVVGWEGRMADPDGHPTKLHEGDDMWAVC